jgi:lactate dehydrogenase-like 2-hydroxyacid dehydrogenase
MWPENQAIPPDVLASEITDAVGVYSMLTDAIDRTLLSRAPDLEVVSNMAVGVDNIDLAACADRGVAVGHTPDVLTDSTADIAWLLVMASTRRMQEGIDLVRAGEWKQWDPEGLLGHDVSRSTIGIIGMGRVGQAIAMRALGFDMDVMYTARSAKPTVETRLGARRASLDELLATSDHVVVAVPLTSDTHRLIGERELAMMKTTANLVNIARGPVVDTDALYEALLTGTIRCAGLDVTDPEPLPPDHKLLTLKNCTVIPHTGSSTWRTRTAMADLAADNLIAALTGESMPHRVPGT